MKRYEDYEEKCYEVYDDKIEPQSYEGDCTTSKVDTAAIANASANVLNGSNGKDVCKTISCVAGIAGIIGLVWISNK